MSLILRPVCHSSFVVIISDSKELFRLIFWHCEYEQRNNCCKWILFKVLDQCNCCFIQWVCYLITLFCLYLYRLVSTLERFTTLLPLASNGSNGTDSITLVRDNFAIFVSENEMMNGSFLSTQVSAVPADDGSGLSFSSAVTVTSIATVNLNPSVFETVQRTSNNASSLRVNTILFNPSSPLFQDNSTNGTGSSILSVRVTPGDTPTDLVEPVNFLFLNNKVSKI